MCRGHASPPISLFIIQWKADMHKQSSNDLLRWSRSYQGKINLKAIYWSFSQPNSQQATSVLINSLILFYEFIKLNLHENWR